MRIHTACLLIPVISADFCTELCNNDGPAICTGGSYDKKGTCHAYFFVGASRTEYCFHTSATASACPDTGAKVRVIDVPRLLSQRTTPSPTTSIAPDVTTTLSPMMPQDAQYIASALSTLSDLPHPWRSHPKARLSNEVDAVIERGGRVSDPLAFWNAGNMNGAIDMMVDGFEARNDNKFLFYHVISLLKFLNIPVAERQAFGLDSGMAARLANKVHLVAEHMPIRISRFWTFSAGDFELMGEYIPAIMQHLHIKRTQVVRGVFSSFQGSPIQGLVFRGNSQTAWTDSLASLTGPADNLRLGVSSVSFLDSDYPSAEEWYTVIAHSLQDESKAGLLRPSPTLNYVEVVAKPSTPIAEYRALGRYLAMSILDAAPLALGFSTSFWAFVLDRTLTIDDVDYTDGALATTLRNINNARSDAELGGFFLTIDGTRHTPTIANRADLLERVLRGSIDPAMRAQLEAVKAGFLDLIPAAFIAPLNVCEIVQLVRGRSAIDLNDMRANLAVRGTVEYRDDSDAPMPTVSTLIQLDFFWRTIEEFDATQHKQFLRALTGLDVVPAGGWAYALGGRISVWVDQRVGALDFDHHGILLLNHESHEEMREEILSMLFVAMHLRQ